MQSVILSGGIKGWVASGDEYVAFMDGFDAAEWEQQQ
jgi:arsenical-resistance protein 2